MTSLEHSVAGAYASVQVARRRVVRILGWIGVGVPSGVSMSSRLDGVVSTGIYAVAVVAVLGHREEFTEDPEQ